MLVNNAGISRDGLLLTMSPKDLKEITDVNQVGTLLVIKAVLGGMVTARAGRVVTIGSVVGTIGESGQVAYAGSKAGLVGITKALALEYARRNIRFNLVAPGFVDTEMTQALPEERRRAILARVPSGQAYTTQQIADAVRETLLSDKTGELVAIDGGMT